MPSPLEKFEALKTFVRSKTEFMMNSNFEGMTPEDAANKIMYQTFDKAIREKLSDEQNKVVDKANEKKEVLEILQGEMKRGNISEAEAQEILNSEEFKSYTAIETKQ